MGPSRKRARPNPPSAEDPTQKVEESKGQSSTTKPSAGLTGDSSDLPIADDDVPTPLKDIKPDGSSTKQVRLSYSHYWALDGVQG